MFTDTIPVPSAEQAQRDDVQEGLAAELGATNPFVTVHTIDGVGAASAATARPLP